MITVEQIMTSRPDLVTLTPDDTVAAAARAMTTHSIHHIPIVDSVGELRGIVSDRDILAATGPDASDDSNTPLSQIMTTNLHSTEATAKVHGVALLLRRLRIGCLPVMQAGELVGIVTDTDFLGVAINLLEVIEETEPERFEA